MPDPDPDNLRRLARLLAAIDARHVGLGDFRADEFPFDPTRPEDLEGGANFRLETRLGDLDVMQWVAGIETEPAYAGLAAGAIAEELDAKGTVTGKAFPRERPVAFVVQSDSG